MVRCHECDPVKEYPAVFIFAHWRDVHGLRFDLYEPTEEEERILLSPSEDLVVHALEMEQERLALLVPTLPLWFRPIARWRLWRLRIDTAKLRDAQIAELLEESDRGAA